MSELTSRGLGFEVWGSSPALNAAGVVSWQTRVTPWPHL